MAGEKPKETSGLSTRAAALAAAGIVLVLLAAAFTGSFLLPFLGTRAAVERCAAEIRSYQLFGVVDSALLPDLPQKELDAEIERLGGPGAAARRLGTYLALPRWLAPDPVTAVRMLGRCKEEAAPVLARTFRDRDEAVRAAVLAAARELELDEERARPLVIQGLGLRDADGGVRLEAATWHVAQGRGREALPVLIALLEDEGSSVRAIAARQLELLGPDARAAVPALEKLLTDESEWVSGNARKALESLRGHAPGAGGAGSENAAPQAP